MSLAASNVMRRYTGEDWQFHSSCCERIWNGTLHTFRIQSTGRNSFLFDPPINNVEGFRLVDSGVLDHTLPYPAFTILWVSDALSYFIDPTNTIDGKPSTTIGISHLEQTGIITKGTRYYAQRTNQLRNIDFTPFDLNLQLANITPGNPLFVTIELYTLKRNIK
jgi:hypothetical protein